MGAYSRVGTYKLFGLSGWAVNGINKVTWTSKSVIKLYKKSSRPALFKSSIFTGPLYSCIVF